MSTDTPQARVAAIIVAYRSAGTIIDCVAPFIADPGVHQVVIVDNSSDAETESLVRALPKVNYLAANNVGFGRGCNLGVASVDTQVDVLAFINPDLVLTRPLEPLLSFLDRHPRTLVAGESSVTSASSARPSVTLRREFVKAIRGSTAYSLPKFPGIDPARVEQLSGAMILTTRAFFDELKGFDEQFELYYEDVDISVRSSQGEGAWLFPLEYAHHAGGVSFSSARGPAFVASRISRIRYLRKHDAGRFLAQKIAAIAITEYIARSVKSQPEGHRVRMLALKYQWSEWRNPNSVHALQRDPITTRSIDSA